jgi:hypothetical protein
MLGLLEREEREEEKEREKREELSRENRRGKASARIDDVVIAERLSLARANQLNNQDKSRKGEIDF